MDQIRRASVAAVLTVLLVRPAVSETITSLVPVDISQHFNWRVQTLLGNAVYFPDGALTVNGIPFQRPTSGLNAWNGWYEISGSMEGLRTIELEVGVYGVSNVYALINTMGGEQLPGTYAALEFYGSNGAFFDLHLDGNDDVRDYLWGEYTNFINGTSTVNAFTSGSRMYEQVRLDMQAIALPAAFGHETLEKIRIVDNGGTIHGVLKQRLIVSGVTVAATPVPEPSTLAMFLGLGCIGLVGVLRHRKLAQRQTVAACR